MALAWARIWQAAAAAIVRLLFVHVYMRMYAEGMALGSVLLTVTMRADEEFAICRWAMHTYGHAAACHGNTVACCL